MTGLPTTSSASSRSVYLRAYRSRSSIPNPSLVSTSFPFERQRDVRQTSSSRTSKSDLSRVRRMKDKDISLSSEHPEADVKHIVRGIARRGLKPLAGKASISLRVD